MSLPASRSRWGRSRRCPLEPAWWTGERLCTALAVAVLVGLVVRAVA